ncbi:N-acetyltransferase, putative [Phytophthora infestans T30-4]|uniref:N-acetyltransferase, putative n=1 Tax=Phytophthora infestans (strain T30-4) TaxID=403677 RepID=D0NEK1_PHYIT|nr:N-acetyltransferase, putative [Phytophthora infestans T30-4]EEY56646.1 N-acetyltransferase, putative [Phytophthora infestans T30-4]|eukprot:XP_002902720.1 N-acetyltransferase, putative [Phytophthora infestans T30-4]
MANVNDALMRRGKLEGNASTAKRKRTSKSSCDDNVACKKSRSSMSTWLSPAAQSKPTRSTITPEPKAATCVKELMSPSKALPSTQSYIDVGQRSFGKLVTCSKCGLLYTAGEEEDEKEHQKFCKRMKRGVTFSKWKKERVLKTVSDTKARILEIRGEDPSSHVKKLLEIKEVLDDALGFVEEKVFLQRPTFVYIQDRQVVGCINTERISEAFTLDKTASNLVTKDDENSVASEGAVTASIDSRSAVVGICQLWVHPSFRRKNIATRMVDVVREKSIYGMHVAKDQIAFAQPTRNGLQFAQKYMEPAEVLIY